MAMSERDWEDEIDERLAAQLEARFLPHTSAQAAHGKVELKDIVGACLEGVLSSSSETTRARALWARAAGEVGNRHTVGIYVKEPEADERPTLIVYLDGHSFVYEFTTDHLLYEQRLEYLGFPVEKIEFRLSNRRAPSRPAQPSLCEVAPGERAHETEAHPTPSALSQSEERWAKTMVEDLPGSLADAILGAIQATKQPEGKKRRKEA